MAKVAVYDSGVGGLTILRALQKKLGISSYTFVSDNQAYPYGTKGAEELKPRVLQCAKAIVDQFDPDILVLACNTASTLVLPLLREHLSLPIVGVVPAIKPAAAFSKNKVIGLLGTPATIDRIYTRDLIQKFASDCEVISVGSSLLVDLAEQKLRGKKVDLSRIESELEPVLQRKDCDVLVLACTHFPLLNNEIGKVFQSKNHTISLLDSSDGIADRTAWLLNAGGLQDSPESRLRMVFTKALGKHSELAASLQEFSVDEIQVLEL